MAAQALSGIAKDLTKMSAKSAIKVIVPDGADGALFKWVARLTGSKNALKGVGFFVGGALLAAFGFVGALVGMAGALVVVLLATVASLSGDLGRSKKKVKFTSLLSKSSEINWLSAARLFLFAARDVWFVVGLPVFLSQLGWSFYAVGAFLALWVIGYGFIQAAVPEILRAFGRRDTVDGAAARQWAFVLLLVPLGLIAALRLGVESRARAHGGPCRLRSGFCDQLGGPFLSGAGLHGRGQRRSERGLLLHGECRRASARHAALRRRVPVCGIPGLPVGIRGACARGCGFVAQPSAWTRGIFQGRRC